MSITGGMSTTENTAYVMQSDIVTVEPVTLHPIQIHEDKEDSSMTKYNSIVNQCTDILKQMIAANLKSAEDIQQVLGSVASAKIKNNLEASRRQAYHKLIEQFQNVIYMILKQKFDHTEIMYLYTKLNGEVSDNDIAQISQTVTKYIFNRKRRIYAKPPDAKIKHVFSLYPILDQKLIMIANTVIGTSLNHTSRQELAEQLIRMLVTQNDMTNHKNLESAKPNCQNIYRRTARLVLRRIIQ